MDKHQLYGMTLFVVVFLIAGIGYVQTLRNAFTLDQTKFVQVGVMEYKTDGDTVYIPVFRKRN